MAELVLETPEGLALRHELAGAGSRAAAGIVDLGLFTMLVMALAVLVTVFAPLDGGVFTSVLGAALIGGMILILILSLTIVPSMWDGRTPGKRLLGIRVVDRRGWHATPRQHFLRALFWPLEVGIAVPIPAGILMMAVLPDCQRLGDLVAGTVCLRERKRGGSLGNEPFQRETWETLPNRRLPLAPALRERFSGEDLAFLRELFGRAGIQSTQRRKLFLRAWNHYAPILGVATATQGDQAAAETTAEAAAEYLRELYLFLRA